MTKTEFLPAGHALASRRDDYVLVPGPKGISQLGHGGFGRTYMGRRERGSLPVAIKEFAPASMSWRADDGHIHPYESERRNFETYLRAFKREANTLSAIDSPHVVKVHDVFDAQGTAFMVMTYLDGRDLHAWATERQPDEYWVMRVFQSLLIGVEKAHERGILHCDIKPANVLLTGDPEQGGMPVLIDFGGARQESVAPDGPPPSAMPPVSTGYSPPEQHMGDPPKRTSDVYALGATLHFLLLRRTPHGALKRMGGDPAISEGWDEAATDLSEPVRRAIEVSMALRPEERPQSVEDLRAVLSGQSFVPVSLPEPELVPRPEPPRSDTPAAPPPVSPEPTVPAWPEATQVAQPPASDAAPSDPPGLTVPVPPAESAAGPEHTEVVAREAGGAAPWGGTQQSPSDAGPATQVVPSQGGLPPPPPPPLQNEAAASAPKKGRARYVLGGLGVALAAVIAFVAVDGSDATGPDVVGNDTRIEIRTDENGRIVERTIDADGNVTDRVIGGNQASGGVLDRIDRNEDEPPADETAFDRAARLCDEGDAGACFDAASMHRDGRAPEADLNVAASLFDRACEGEEAAACEALGDLYLFEDIDGATDARALAAFEAGCALEHTASCASIGLMHEQNRVPRPDDQLAGRYVEDGCDAGIAWACTTLGHLYFTDRVRGSDEQLASAYRAGCDGGDSNGCVGLGVAVARGLAEADELDDLGRDLSRSCGDGNGLACGGLGALHYDGRLSNSNDARAASFLDQGCDLDDTYSCTLLGSMFAEGRTTRITADTAEGHLLGACNDGTGFACFDLGEIYRAGSVAGRSELDARRFYRRGCDLGWEDSCGALR